MMIRKQTQGKIGLGILGLALVLAGCPAARAQQAEPQFYAAMRWRSIGPFRGGRALAVTGVLGEPNAYYFGSVGGGVWKTTNAGLTWMPLFQHEGTASIGAIAVAPSDPNVIYAGTGEADMRSDISIGDGIYKSTDAGRTWTPLGLAETRQVAKILVDPRNPDVVLVAALGHAYGPNAERGVYRSTDGGHNWRKVLYKDENTGAIDLAFAPGNSSIVYAALWQTRRPAWSQYAPLGGPGGGIYKSSDGGATWQALAGHGLPAGPLGRIGLAVGPGDQGERVYALIDCQQGGLYRSDDGGSIWQQVSKDPRIWSRDWYFGDVTVDPKNAGVVWIPNVALYRSTDGGRQFDAVKGAPGGDDYHALWIDPADSARMILGSDQGTVISLDGGRTWSSWYNQPTAQFYHVAADHRIPYWVYGAQQDSGTAGTPSRSDYGSISFRDWHPVGGARAATSFPIPPIPPSFTPATPTARCTSGTHGPRRRKPLPPGWSAMPLPRASTSANTGSPGLRPSRFRPKTRTCSTTAPRCCSKPPMAAPVGAPPAPTSPSSPPPPNPIAASSTRLLHRRSAPAKSGWEPTTD